MYKMFISVLAASLGLAASANVVAGGLFSKTGPVIAIMANDLFLGEAEGHLSGAGTIAIHSQRNPDVTCAGQFTSSAELGGSGEMQCSNGATGTYHFERLSLEKGYGIGSYRWPLDEFYIPTHLRRIQALPQVASRHETRKQGQSTGACRYLARGAAQTCEYRQSKDSARLSRARQK